MRGKGLVTSLTILALLFGPVQGLAQECEYIPVEEGGEQVMKRHLLIDGEVFFYLPLEESKELQKRAEDYPLLAKKNRLLEQENESLKAITDVQSSTIDRLGAESEFTHEFVENAWEPPQKPWYKSSEVSFTLGVVFAATMYGFWSYTNKVNKVNE